MGAVGGGVVLIFYVIVLVAAILLFFLPFFVYRIRNEIIALNKTIEAINTNIIGIGQNTYICAKSLRALTGEIKPLAKHVVSSKD